MLGGVLSYQFIECEMLFPFDCTKITKIPLRPQVGVFGDRMAMTNNPCFEVNFTRQYLSLHQNTMVLTNV